MCGTTARLLLAAAAFVVAPLAACVEGDGPPIYHTVQESACPTGSAKREGVSKDIITNFYPCCDGTAHLIPDFLVPKDFRAMLATGANGSLCVPDEFSTDGNFTPQRCTSLFGQPGACLSSCIPQVSEAKVKLPKDSCPGNQLCAPCIDPQTNKPTGACNQGAMACDPIDGAPTGPCKDYDPTLDISTYTACGPRAHCAPDDLVTEKDRGQLGKCADGTSWCVPDDFLKRGGRYTPPSCRSVGDREGRCLSTAIPKIAAEKATLPVATCNALDEVCAPCYDPRTGMGTGACTQGFCEKGPVEPPKTFQQCGANPDEAFCVPASLIPAAELKNFDAIGCLGGGAKCSEAGTVCVPKKIIDAGTGFSPKKCKNGLTGFLAAFQKFFGNPFAAIAALSEYSDGRCISQCLPAVRPNAKLLGGKGCDSGEVCAPCFDPQKLSQGKVPTGACDR